MFPDDEVEGEPETQENPESEWLDVDSGESNAPEYVAPTEDTVHVIAPDPVQSDPVVVAGSVTPSGAPASPAMARNTESGMKVTHSVGVSVDPIVIEPVRGSGVTSEGHRWVAFRKSKPEIVASGVTQTEAKIKILEMEGEAAKKKSTPVAPKSPGPLTKG